MLVVSLNFFLFVLGTTTTMSSGQFVSTRVLFDEQATEQAKFLCAQAIDKQLQRTGYFVTDHLPFTIHAKDNDGDILDAAAQLFSLPKEVKEQYSIAKGRGFVPLGKESGVKQLMEVKEAFSLGHPHQDVDGQATRSCDNLAHPLQECNVWPPQVSSTIQRDIEKVVVNSALFSKTVMLYLAKVIALETNQSEFESFVSKEINGGETISLMRVFNYFDPRDLAEPSLLLTEPSSSLLQEEQFIGSSPHTDWGLLTVITHNNAPGLQFFDPHASSWQSLPPPLEEEKFIVVNGGDFLRLLSQGRYHSPVHRVLTHNAHANQHSPTNRISFVYFFYPGFNATIPTLTTTTTTTGDNGNCSNNHENNATQTQGHFEEFQFNTLLREPTTTTEEATTTATSNVTFGDYIMRKWKGVYR